MRKSFAPLLKMCIKLGLACAERAEVVHGCQSLTHKLIPIVCADTRDLLSAKAQLASF